MSQLSRSNTDLPSLNRRSWGDSWRTPVSFSTWLLAAARLDHPDDPEREVVPILELRLDVLERGRRLVAGPGLEDGRGLVGGQELVHLFGGGKGRDAVFQGHEVPPGARGSPVPF